MDSIKTCYVATSTIPNAGMGLFAARDLLPEECVVEYTGEVLNFQQARLRKNRSYMKAVGLDKHIDAADPAKSSVARYVNDTVEPAKRNCQFKTIGGKVFVQTTRVVRKDEEFFVDYGRGHWLYCEDLPTAQAFLSLSLRPLGGGVQAEDYFDENTSLCTLSSLHWRSRFGPGLGVSVRHQSSSFPNANCKVQPNPFLKGTKFIRATRKIQKGEELILETSPSDEKLCRGGFYLSGFGEFQGVPSNPTTKLIGNLSAYAAELNILGMDVWEVSTQGVQLGFEKAQQLVQARYSPGKNLSPEAIAYVHFGVFAGSSCFHLESRARNLMNFVIPDEGGNQPRDEPVSVQDGSTESYRQCMLDLVDLRDRLVKLGYKVEISYDAGDYICNYTYYSSLRRITPGGWGHDDSLFVHVPSFDVADEQHQLAFAKDLLWLLSRQHAPSRNAVNLIRV